MKKKNPNQYTLYKTEDTLKTEAKERILAEQQAASNRKPVPAAQKKLENYWYHYKWHTIGAVLLLILGIFFLAETVFKTKPDITLVLVSSSTIDDTSLETLQGLLETYTRDINGDSKVAVAIDYIHFVPDTVVHTQGNSTSAMAGQTEYASAVKLSAVLASGVDPLYLVDDAVYDYIYKLASSDQGATSPLFFQKLDTVSGVEGDRLFLSQTRLADMNSARMLPGDLSFCLRSYGAKSDKMHDYVMGCLDLLNALVN